MCTLWTAACQAPLSMGFSKQEYCSGLPCPPLGDLPDPGIESLMSPALAGGFFTNSATWEDQFYSLYLYNLVFKTALKICSEFQYHSRSEIL